MEYKSIFISDVHLGSKGCQADLLCDFLKQNSSEYLYLVADIIDGWRLRRKFYWPREVFPFFFCLSMVLEIGAGG